jgi:hypothetical protein
MNKIWDKENNQLYLLLIICFFSVYYLPVIITRILFAGFILFIFRTKKDYFWLVFFFILNDAPGRLFSAGTHEELMRLPIYSFGKGFSFGFQELFLIAYLLKAIFRKERLDFVFIKQFKLFFLFGALVVIFSWLFGINSGTLLPTFRALLPWSWVIIFPFFIRDKVTLVNVSRLLFPVVFLSLASQISTYFTGMYWDSFYVHTQILEENISPGGEALRSYSSVYIILFCIFQSCFYLFTDNPSFNRNYLILLIFISSISVFLTSIRGWIIGLSVSYLLFILFIQSGKSLWNIFRIIILSALLIMILQFIYPVIGRQIDNSLTRLSTMEDLARGDLTARGTVSRITERSPIVMNEFWKSPIFGWGFTNNFYEYSDGHVGNQNILLNVGIIGYSFLLFIYLSIFFKIWRWSTNPSVVAYYGSSLKIFAIAMLAIFIIHSSSTQFWGYNLHFDQLQKLLFYAFFLSSVNALIISTKFPIHQV